MAEISKRKTVFEKLSVIDKFYNCNDGDFVEVTEWTNGEGFDCDIFRTSEGHTRFSLSYDILEGIQYLLGKIKYEENND